MLTSPLLATTVPVLVLKTHRYAVHHGALGIVRNLGSIGVPAYAIVEDRWAPLAMSRYLTGAFLLPSENLDADSFRNEMAVIGGMLKRPTVLVPTDDMAAILVAEQAKELRQWFLFPHLPAELPRLLANKVSLYNLCREFGAPCPECAFPKSIEDLDEFIRRAVFPIVVKAAAQWRPLHSVPSTLIVQTPEELRAVYVKLEAWQCPNIMVQEFIPGEDWILHGYCNQETNCFLPFTGRKLRSYPPFAGITTLGVSVANERLAEQTRLFLNAVGYSGIMDLDYRFDKRNGEYKLLDFNPRAGANFRMFDDEAGINAVRALHLDLSGRSVRRSPLVEGRVFIVEPFDLVACLNYWSKGGVTLRELRSSFRGPKEFAWFSWRDPLPFLAMCIRLLFRGLRRRPKFKRK